MSQFPPLQQIFLQQQDALLMSIFPLGGGGGGEDEEDPISRLRSGALLSPPRWLGPFSFSSPSPPDIPVALWDPNKWSPPCSLQINHAAAPLPGFDIRGINEDQIRSITNAFFSKESIIMCYLTSVRRPKPLVKIRILDDDGEEEEELLLFSRKEMDTFPKETDNRFNVVIVEVHHRDPYVHHLRSQCWGGSSTENCDEDKHKILAPWPEVPNTTVCGRPKSTSRIRLRKTKGAAITLDVQQCFFEELTGASNSRRLSEGSSEGNILLSRNEKPKEILGGLWKGCEDASEAVRGNGKPKEINPEKSGSGHVESPLAFDQSNTHPEIMRLDNGEAVGSTDAVQNYFEERSKADKPSKTKWSGVWEHFVERRIDGTVWAYCKHCNNRLKADSKTKGTTSLHRHLKKLHGIIVDKASSSKNEKNLCGDPATSKSKTPTPSPRPPLAPVASKPSRTTRQRKKRTTDGANEIATQEVSAGGKRTRRGDDPSISGVAPGEVPSSAPPPTVKHAKEMVAASSQIALPAAGAAGEVLRSIADTIINPGPKDLAKAILLMSQVAEAIAREKLLLPEMEKLRQQNAQVADQSTALHSRLEALEAKFALAADENKKVKTENAALRTKLQLQVSQNSTNRACLLQDSVFADHKYVERPDLSETAPEMWPSVVTAPKAGLPAFKAQEYITAALDTPSAITSAHIDAAMEYVASMEEEGAAKTVMFQSATATLTGQVLKCFTPGDTSFMSEMVINAYAELMSTPVSPDQPTRIGPNTLVYCTSRTEWLTQHLEPHPNPTPALIRNKKAHMKEYFDYEKVHFAVNIDKVHWILATMDTKQHEIQILDPLLNFHASEKKIKRLLQGIEAEVCIVRKHGSPHLPNVTNWPIREIRDIPEQHDGFSCGKFVLWYMDATKMRTGFSQTDIYDSNGKMLAELIFSHINRKTEVKEAICKLMHKAKIAA